MKAILAFFSPNAWNVFRRNLLAWQKYALSSMAINIVEPFAYFLALGFGLGAYLTLKGHGSLVQFMAPGFMGFTAMNTVSFDASWGGYERMNFNGVYESMVTTPVQPEEIAAGEYLWEAFRAVMYGLLFLAVITAFGLVHSWLALLCPIVLALTGIMYAIPALWVAFLVKTQEHLFYYFSFVITPTMMIAGVFFPLDRVPHWLQVVAWFTPLYHSVNIFRSLVLGRVGWGNAVDLLWILAAIAVLATLPLRTLRSRLAN
jgi:lipooligosaccharide transport system permease protein